MLAAPLAASLAVVPAAAAGPLTLNGHGPIRQLRCAASPCVRTLRSLRGHPVVTLTRLRALMQDGSGESVYELAWKIGTPRVHLRAEALSPPDPLGQIVLQSMSRWAANSRPQGFVGALNGDFFTYTGGWQAKPSGMLVQDRTIRAFGWGGPGAGLTAASAGGPQGGIVYGSPRAVPATIGLPKGKAVTIGGFAGSGAGVRARIGSLPGDQVLVVTGTGVEVTLPAGSVGVVVGSSQVANPLMHMLRGTRSGYHNPTNTTTQARETVAGFRFAEEGQAQREVALPISRHSCPTGVCAAGKAVTHHSRPGAAGGSQYAASPPRLLLPRRRDDSRGERQCRRGTLGARG